MIDLLNVLFDALLDSIKLLPFLFLVYFFIELIENKSSNNFKSSHLLNGGLSPLIGASAGMIPQCGFSVMATNLFSCRHINAAALIAIYIATSDEALPIMLSDVANVPDIFLSVILPLILIKFVLAVIVGYAIYFLCKSPKSIFNGDQIKIDNDNKTVALIQNHGSAASCIKDKHFDIITSTVTDDHDDVGCCGHNITKETSKAKKYLLHPLIHSAKIFIYILIINAVFGIIIFHLGEKAISDALSSVGYFQPLFATFVGLIPNCASSVILTQLFVSKSITLGSAIAGLSANSGIALAVLFKQNKNIKQNFAIVLTLITVSVLTGTLLMVFGVEF